MGAFDQARLHGLPQPRLEIKYWRAVVSIADANVSATSSDRPACRAAFNKKIPRNEPQ